MKIYYKIFGCRLNLAETIEIAESLSNFDIKRCETIDKADFLLIKTCAVTLEAEKKSFLEIKRALEFENLKLIFVAGCGEDELRKRTEDIEGHKKVIFLNKGKESEEIKNLIKQFFPNNNINSLHSSYSKQALKECSLIGKTRFFLKIHDGCNNFCSFCQIPFYRGKERSLKKEEIILKIKKIENHFKEVVLTGINPSNWRDGKHDIGDLLLDIIEKTKIKRIRIGSLEPFEKEESEKNFLSKIKIAFQSKIFCNHFHFSLQSGNDRILKLMRRKYKKSDYQRLVEKIRELDEKTNFTTDCIVGFPTEKENEFFETAEFCKKLKLSKIHVFPYSDRNDTISSRMDGKISQQEIKKRSEVLRKVSEELKTEFLKDNLGILHDVLFEEERSCFFKGYTRNYLGFLLEKNKKLSRNDVINEILKVKAEEIFKLNNRNEFLFCKNYF